MTLNANHTARPQKGSINTSPAKALPRPQNMWQARNALSAALREALEIEKHTPEAKAAWAKMFQAERQLVELYVATADKRSLDYLASIISKRQHQGQ